MLKSNNVVGLAGRMNFTENTVIYIALKQLLVCIHVNLSGVDPA